MTNTQILHRHRLALVAWSTATLFALISFNALDDSKTSDVALYVNWYAAGAAIASAIVALVLTLMAYFGPDVVDVVVEVKPAEPSDAEKVAIALRAAADQAIAVAAAMSPVNEPTVEKYTDPR